MYCCTRVLDVKEYAFKREESHAKQHGVFDALIIWDAITRTKLVTSM